jgi:hypothetical protein
VAAVGTTLTLTQEVTIVNKGGEAIKGIVPHPEPGLKAYLTPLKANSGKRGNMQ